MLMHNDYMANLLCTLRYFFLCFLDFSFAFYTPQLNSPKVWEFDQDHQRWLPVAELADPGNKGDQVYAAAWAPNIGRPYELIAVSTTKGISIWQMASNPDPNGRLSVEKAVMFPCIDSEAALDPFPGTMTDADKTAALKTDVYKKAHSALLLCLDNKVLREVNKEDSAADVDIDDEDQALMLLTSLPPSYDNFVETLLYGR
nr:protein SEH1 [Tanacetum cinerariifolium]